MPKANWGIRASTVDQFDRSSQYTPYTGPIPPNGVYQWHLKKLTYVAATREKLPQLRVGLELDPRNKAEERYGGYWLMAFLNIGENNEFTYVPFLDAIGVTGSDFIDRTITDQEGNVKKIGPWRNTGEEYILAQVKDGRDKDGKPRKEIGWFGPLPEETDDDEEELDEEEYDEDDEVPF